MFHHRTNRKKERRTVKILDIQTHIMPTTKQYRNKLNRTKKENKYGNETKRTKNRSPGSFAANNIRLKKCLISVEMLKRKNKMQVK